MAIEAVELELPDVEELETPFKRRVALLVVSITLFGSIVALLQNQASTRQDIAARDAQRSAVLGLGTQVATSARTIFSYGVYAESQQVERRRVVAAGRARLATSSPQNQAFQAEAERWARVKTFLVPLSPLLSQDPYKPENDPAFPTRYETDQGVDADVATLRQAAQGEAAEKWGAKADKYVAIITLLAVVLFLLGMSLTIGGRVRLVFVTPAAVIALWCLFSTVTLLLQSVTATPDLAVRRVATGNALVAQRDFEGAIRQYTEAITLRPDYAIAYGQRADAHFLLGSSQSTQQFVSITDPKALKQAIADGETAVRLGADSSINVVGNLGFHYFLDRRYAEAERLTAKALELNNAIPSVWFNLGVIKVAQGDLDGAEEAYRTAIRLTSPSQRPDESERDSLFAAARTDLEILALAQPGRLDVVRRFQGQIVAGESEAKLKEPTGTVPDGISFSNFEFAAKGASITASYDYENVPEGTHLAFLWYLRADSSTPWSQEPVINSFESSAVNESGRAEITRSPGRCPIPGQYRLDVFAEGRLVGSGETEVEPGALGLPIPFRDELLGLSLCRPSDWEAEPPKDDLVTFTSPDGRLSLIVGSTPIPSSGVGTAAPLEDTAIAAAAAAVTGIKDRNPGAPSQGFTFGGVKGRVRYYDASGGQVSVAIAASVGPDSVLRTLAGVAPQDRLDTLNELLDTLQFDVG